ncbi:MAG: hypothetical protein ACK50A_12070 [Sphingobacteriaceae bacterium]
MKKYTLLLLVISCIMVISCKKEDKSTNESRKLFTYNSIASDNTVIKQGNVTRITANITGEGSFYWTCSSGELFGSGNSIVFGAGSCCTGDHTVTCTVKDKNNNSEAKSVTINVTQ